MDDERDRSQQWLQSQLRLARAANIIQTEDYFLEDSKALATLISLRNEASAVAMLLKDLLTGESLIPTGVSGPLLALTLTRSGVICRQEAAARVLWQASKTAKSHSEPGTPSQGLQCIPMQSQINGRCPSR